MEKGKISVVITTYNRRKFLEKAIDSVFSQTYKNIEIIVIDDASKDDTAEYMKKFEKNKRVKFIKNTENKGCGENRKIGVLEYATGEYINFLDDDDLFINKEYFEQAIKLFNQNKKLSMVCAPHVVYNTLDDSKSNKKFPYNKAVDNKEFFLNFGNEKFPKPIISVAIIKREALEFAEYQNMEILNDTTIFLRALLYGPMGFIKETSAQYLVHGNNISFSCNVNFIIQNLEEKYKVYKLIEKHFDFDESKRKDWLLKQADITIIYFIVGSKPSFLDFCKILKWTKKRLNNKEKIKEYKQIYKQNRKKPRQI